MREEEIDSWIEALERGDKGAWKRSWQRRRERNAAPKDLRSAPRISNWKALKPTRIGLQWLPRTTRTSLPLGEKCICREKGAAIFSGRGLCTKCYSFPAVVSTQPLSLEGRKRRWRIHRAAEKPRWDVSTTFP
ncbi:hypothetical protein ALC56_15170 [Trachymyrmex septentrionalis]|uniref:PH domain-containing protein n=1 Tax=Trachymyrmex septentrionalis TaxID=34720 RepID=A0A195ERH0_9HYME|nr:hypothetical protein ALC56_15170 [Trachymyrmex septentrionalis]